MSIHISGTVPDQEIVDRQIVHPLAGVVFADDSSSATETVTVTLSDVDDGSFYNFGSGFYDPYAGEYLVTGSAAAVTAALQGLEFIPTPLLAATTTFTIAVDDGLGAPATDSSTSVVTHVTSGGGQTLTEAPGFVVSLANTGSDFDTVNGSDGDVYLSSAEASIVGGDVGVHFAVGSAVSLYGTNGHWDTIDGYSGYVYLNSAQTSVVGGNFAISFSDDAANAVSLYDTTYQDAVSGGTGVIVLNDAQVIVQSGVYTVFFGAGTTNSVYFSNSFSSAGSQWETVIGSSGSVTCGNVNGSVIGGGDSINSFGGGALSLYQTAGDWDNVKISGSTVVLNAAQAFIDGEADSIFFNNDPSNAVSLSNTGGQWDAVYGSGGAVTLNGAQASILGGGDSIVFNGDSSNAVSLYKTNGGADGVTGSNGTLFLNDAQATILGFGNAVYLNGFTNRLAFGPTVGQATVHGFGFHDVLQFSKSDFADFAALHPTQSGADTVIALDASHSVTLTNVNASSLTSAQFAFA